MRGLCGRGNSLLLAAREAETCKAKAEKSECRGLGHADGRIKAIHSARYR